MADPRGYVLARIAFDTNGRGCWLWSLSLRHGYGRAAGPRRIGAHVFSWEAFRGPRHGLWVLHTCDVPACVNPDHLYLGDARDNARDRVARGRSARLHGELNPAARLDARTVILIRARLAKGETQAAVARRYGVSPATISAIRSGRSWGCVAGAATPSAMSAV